jgi:hypothetical protein
MTLANHPMTAEGFGETAFFEREINWSSVGTGAGIAGALPAIEQALHFW